MRILLACLFVCSVFFSGCYYDSKENLYPVLGCNDTINVTYSGKIVPILNSYCTSCHSGSNPGGNLNLTQYSVVKTLVDNGQLLNSIKQNGTIEAMPKGGGKLDDCKIAAFSKWITLGSLNN